MKPQESHQGIDRQPADEHAALSTAVSEITERRAVIDQAKGMLMLVYGLTADAAFELLRWHSQQTNTKVRLLAERLLREFPDIHRTGTASDYDRALATLHLRVDPPPDADASGSPARDSRSS